MCRYARFTLLFLLFGSLAQAQESQRTYRKFKLDNGIKVVLVSDPGVNISAASMDISIGSLANSKERQGMAHFLEHMLFLGTKKYPELNAYGAYLKARGGYSNAFTAQDHTNYHFQVNHDGLSGALDRFAQFFIAPLLDYQYASKEVKAVNSEHQKNIPNDVWRWRQVYRSLLTKGHPANGFTTGNLKTLEGTKESELRQFFQQYYGPERMALCIVAKASLDAQEKLVREMFSAIPRRKLEPFDVSPMILAPQEALRLIRVVPVTELRQLHLIYPLPRQRADDGSHSGGLVGMTMGDEGPGSLLSYLKRQGLATSLSAGLRHDTRYWGSCRITVGLTPRGVRRHREVIDLCLAYLELLRKSPFPTEHWNEMHALSRLQERYAPKPEGTDAATAIASAANTYGLKLAERIDYYFTQPDEQKYRKLLGQLVPRNLLCVLIDKGLKTDKVEPWYGAKYSYKADAAAYQSLLAPKLPAGISLPRANPFIPKSTAVLSERPVKILATPGVTLWYAQDTEFKRPKVSIQLHILTRQAYVSARNQALLMLHTAMVKEALNEYSYPALVAGLTYSVVATRRGVMLTLGGYSDSAFKLLGIVGRQLTRDDYSAKLFQVEKSKIERVLGNFPLGQAYSVAGQLSGQLTLKQYYPRHQLLAALDSLTLDDLKQFISTVFARTHIQGMCHGNVSAPRIRQAISSLARSLASRPLDRRDAQEDEHVWLGAGEDQSYAAVGRTNNACLRMEYQLGRANLPTQAAAWILGRALQNGFYTEMRTKQQLGYIVWSGTYDQAGVQKQVFIIQSSAYPARELFKRADAHVASVSKMLEKMPDKLFAAIRSSLIKDRLKKPKSISQKGSLFYQQAFAHKANFDRLRHEIAALQAVKKADVLALARRAFDVKTRRRLTIMLNAKQQGKDKGQTSVTDFRAFHKGRTFSKR